MIKDIEGLAKVGETGELDFAIDRIKIADKNLKEIEAGVTV